MPKLFALDSMAILYRSHFSMIRNPLINSKGLNTSGIYGFFSQVIKIIESEKPDYLAVVSDSSEPTFRHKQFPEYKATREKMPDDLVDQLPYLGKLIEALNLPYLIMPGFEADDIIGTLIRICKESQIEGVIVTSDKDYMQLVSDITTMLDHNNKKIGIKQVQEKFGCLPKQVIDILGLMGDSSDNVPGVKGVGEKTAMKLIAEYQTIPNLYENLENLPKNKLYEKLVNDRENAFLSRELVTIDTTVPLKINIEDLSLTEIQLNGNSALIQVLEELEFKSFLKRFKTSSETGVSIPAKDFKIEEVQGAQLLIDIIPYVVEEIISIEGFKDIVSKIKEKNIVALTLLKETDYIIEGRISNLQFCIDPDTVYHLPISNFSLAEKSEIYSEIKIILESPEIAKIIYDWKSSFQLLSNRLINVKNIFDILIATYLLETEQQNFSMESILSRQLNFTKNHVVSKSKKESESGVTQEEEEKQSSAEDLTMIMQLYPWLKNQLTRTGMAPVFNHLEIPLVTELGKMELNGVNIDVSSLQKLSKEFENRLKALTKDIYELAGEPFHINSISELQKVLYDKLEVHIKCNVKPKRIKLGNKMSTDEETLEKMLKHPLPGLLLQYRELNKLKNTYVDQLPTFIHPKTGLIHSSFRQIGAATGRFSSDKPNLQNIPIRTEEGRRIRSVFIPSSTDRVLISADYSQIELRIVAHYSKDPTFIKAYQNNLDIHALTASTIFKVGESEVNREMRSKAKAVNFGLIYRMGPERLALITQTTKTEAKIFIELYFEKYSTIHGLQEHFLEQSRKEGYTQTLLGRRRYLPEINGRGLKRRMAEQAAVNSPIQGSAADIIKLAMNAVIRRFEKENLQSRMILTVHDELVFDALKSEQDKVCEILKEEMENVITLEVPLSVDIGVGSNWLEAH